MPTNVADVLRALAAADPKVAAALIEEDDSFDLSLLIAIDDQVVPRSQWPVTAVADGAIVEVHVVFVGG